MKRLIFISVALLTTWQPYAQEVSFYPELYKVNGRPKKVKISQPADDGRVYQYIVIDYDYEQQISTITRYREKCRDCSEFKSMGIIGVRPLSAGADTVYTFTGRRYHLDNSIITRYTTRLADGSLLVAFPGDKNEYKKLILDEKGRVVETQIYYQDTVRAKWEHEYDDAGRSITTRFATARGELIGTHRTTYDSHGNPVESWITARGEEDSHSQAEYEYDEHGNFTRYSETFDGEPNITVVREITY